MVSTVTCHLSVKVYYDALYAYSLVMYYLPGKFPVTWFGNGWGIEVFLGVTIGIWLFDCDKQFDNECICKTYYKMNTNIY